MTRKQKGAADPPAGTCNKSEKKKAADQLRHAGQKPVFLPVLFSFTLSLFSLARRPATIAKDREKVPRGSRNTTLQEEVSLLSLSPPHSLLVADRAGINRVCVVS
jgi:hypothetical protein